MIKDGTKVLEYKFAIHNKITCFVTRSFKRYNKKHSRNHLIYSTCKIRKSGARITAANKIK